MKRILSDIGKQPWLTYIRILTGWQKETGLRSQLIRGSGGTFVLKVAFVCMGFITSLILARMLGAEGYGVYAYAIAWINVLIVLPIFGLDTILTREIPIYRQQSEWGLLRGIILFSNRFVFIASVSVMLVVAAIAWLVQSNSPSDSLTPFMIALPLIPLLSLTTLKRASMHGLHHIVQGSMPEMLIRPLLLILLIATIYIFQFLPHSPAIALGANLLATFTALVISSMWLTKTIPESAKSNQPLFKNKVWLYGAAPLAFVSIMQVINHKADIVMLGIYREMHDVGIYAICSQLATLVTFILTVVNAALGPTIAGLYAKGNIASLQNIITKSARIVALSALATAMFILITDDLILRLFGDQFQKGESALAILVSGQIINALMGSVALLLAMSGHGKQVAIGVSVAASLNIMMNSLLIPKWGIEGAAIATATSMACWNILLMNWVRKKIGIDPTALGWFSTLNPKA